MVLADANEGNESVVRNAALDMFISPDINEDKLIDVTFLQICKLKPPVVIDAIVMLVSDGLLFITRPAYVLTSCDKSIDKRELSLEMVIVPPTCLSCGRERFVTPDFVTVNA